MSEDRTNVCAWSWHSSRIEVQTMPVLHVCHLPVNHVEPCRCGCGATTGPRSQA